MSHLEFDISHTDEHRLVISDFPSSTTVRLSFTCLSFYDLSRSSWLNTGMRDVPINLSCTFHANHLLMLLQCRSSLSFGMKQTSSCFSATISLSTFVIVYIFLSRLNWYFITLKNVHSCGTFVAMERIVFAKCIFNWVAHIALTWCTNDVHYTVPWMWREGLHGLQLGRGGAQNYIYPSCDHMQPVWPARTWWRAPCLRFKKCDGHWASETASFPVRKHIHVGGSGERWCMQGGLRKVELFPLFNKLCQRDDELAWWTAHRMRRRTSKCHRKYILPQRAPVVGIPRGKQIYQAHSWLGDIFIWKVRPVSNRQLVIFAKISLSMYWIFWSERLSGDKHTSCESNQSTATCLQIRSKFLVDCLFQRWEMNRLGRWTDWGESALLNVYWRWCTCVFMFLRCGFLSSLWFRAFHSAPSFTIISKSTDSYLAVTIPNCSHSVFSWICWMLSSTGGRLPSQTAAAIMLLSQIAMCAIFSISARLDVQDLKVYI